MIPKDVPDNLRAVTLARPWPWVIVEGRLARAFGRDFYPPPALVGQVIAIHAQADHWDEALNERLREYVPSPTDPERHLCGIVGLARLVGWSWKEGSNLSLVPSSLFPGKFLWCLEDVTPIEVVPARGVPKSKPLERHWRVAPERVATIRSRLERKLAPYGFGQMRML